MRNPGGGPRSSSACAVVDEAEEEAAGLVGREEAGLAGCGGAEVGFSGVMRVACGGAVMRSVLGQWRSRWAVVRYAAPVDGPDGCAASAARTGRIWVHAGPIWASTWLVLQVRCGASVDSMDDFKVEIDVQSYLTIVDGKRVYTRGRTWDFMVGGRNLSVAQIKAAVEEKFRWSADQRMAIWYGTGDNTVQLICDSEIVALFDKCFGKKIVRFGVTIENKQQNYEPAPNMAGNDDNQPPIMVEKDDDQPVHAPFFAWPKQAYAGEYEDDEPVGYNGESTYLGEENDDAKPQNNAEPEVVAKRVPLGTLNVDNSYDPQHVQGDDESLVANNAAPTYIHDKNNPRIEVGATFPDSKAFKVALRQVAIREDWSFDTEYSEPQRFRAKCTDEDCPWRIHASKIKNTKTFMIKKLPFGHTCGSANCSKGMANRDWLADKGKAALQEDATVSAK
ncbi:hypothetical protein ACQ4PT_066157 [Festuca glaucescens]